MIAYTGRERILSRPTVELMTTDQLTPEQRAYRLRQPESVPVDLNALTADLRRRGDLVARTVYECPICEARFLGEQRCPDCHVFCRRLGPGGSCPHCDDPVTLTDLLDLEEVQH